MKLLTRNTSAFKFLTLGGLLSKKVFDTNLKREIPTHFQEAHYLQAKQAFGVDEENVRSFVMQLLQDGLGWQTVKKDHDVLATSGDESILIECKRHDSRQLYIDEHRGGGANETCVEELHRNLSRTGCKWGLLTDGVVFRFYYNKDIAPDLVDCYLEFCLQDIVHSTHRWPAEFYWLIDFLSPVSTLRKLDPTHLDALSLQDVRKIVRMIKDSPGSLYTVIKALAVAALEDMGVRPLHTGLPSIKSATTKSQFLGIFQSIESLDPDFHKSSHKISEDMCAEMHDLLDDLGDLDFSHVDHEFFGIVYQKVIHNGNASHYTNTKLSREMANYIASQSTKSQRGNTRPIYLEDGDYILDPALGSGQLLRGLLPFHRVFFRGNSSGIDGWRSLANHFMGRDIDEDAIWVAKINIWLATADKGEPLVSLPEFKKLDVITATISRRAGETIKEAFGIDEEKQVAACVSNPPWDAFKNDSRRGVTYEQETVDKIKASLTLEVRQLNRAQIFLRIIQKLGEESRNMRFAVILPDSLFVDTNDSIRASLRPNLDFYFSYPRNVDPDAKVKIFGDVDLTRKFGIIFGRSTTEFERLICYPLGNNTPIEIDQLLSTIGSHSAFPLFSHPLQASIVRKWKQSVARFHDWRTGEFDQSLWENRNGREESSSGRYRVYGGGAFSDESSAWSKNPIDREKTWKRMKSLAKSDLDIRNIGRTLFLDYINNSDKLNLASYVPANSGVNVTNKVVYSTDAAPSDWLIFDSAIFGSLIEAYGTSQNMNAWRLKAVGAPRELAAQTPLEANIELCEILELTVEEARLIFELNSKWLSLAISAKSWAERIAHLPAGEREISDEREQIRRARRPASQQRRNRSGQRP